MRIGLMRARSHALPDMKHQRLHIKDILSIRNEITRRKCKRFQIRPENDL